MHSPIVFLSITIHFYTYYTIKFIINYNIIDCCLDLIPIVHYLGTHICGLHRTQAVRRIDH